MSSCAKLERIAENDPSPKKQMTKVPIVGNWKILPDTGKPQNYYLSNVNDTEFVPIDVPSNWYSRGIDHSGVSWYRSNFNVDSVDNSTQRYALQFDGVDYFADVWVNGDYVGFHEGYFQKFRFDVSTVIKKGRNQLVVRVNSPEEKATRSWSLHKRYIKGVLGHHDTRPGGAWSERGQEQNTGGIWEPVWFESTPYASLENVMFMPSVDSISGDSDAVVEVNVHAVLEGFYNVDWTLGLMDLDSLLQQPSEEIGSKRIFLEKGDNTFRFKLPSKKRKLWNPWDLGDPHLYRLQVRLNHKGDPAGERNIDVGFREFAVEGKQKKWILNGKPVFVRGTNYIPWQWLSDMSYRDFEHDIRMMKEANINAIRVHAHVLPQRFYEVANKMGMLVWQDFPLQWGYIDTSEFVENASRQAKEMVRQFYNHPSIVVWSAHNEPPWDAKWMKYKYLDYKKGQNQLLDENVYKALKETDSTRYSHLSSLTSEHPWLGWYSGKWQDYQRPAKENWITEFGAQALPSKMTLASIVGQENLWPVSKQQKALWKYHNFQEHQTHKIAGVSKGKNIDELIENTQGYQSQLTKFAAESYRRQKYSPVSAIFQFMFVENWPSFNWGIVDYKRNTKPAYESLRVAYQPLLPSIEYNANRSVSNNSPKFGLWIVNDYATDFTGHTLKYRLYKNSSLMEEQVFETKISRSSAFKVVDIHKSNMLPGDYHIDLVISNEGKVIAENQHYFTIGK
ncbi:hypothetical protein A9Q99_00445 [Gammaproteobacteria bacterium 45_16_T64]|nr:hypothetical protein A9Q99_00445 [Gammaproteobacteria bacterium 45_16_T64]